MGTIPACTGEPPGRDVGPWLPTDYPRVYGGTSAGVAWGSTFIGLSPRVRGNRIGRRTDQPTVRTIPACTGEPGPRSCRPRTGPDYPRVYGGTIDHDGEYNEGQGLSPRVRGNLFVQGLHPPPVGTIPACTGEPAAVGSALEDFGDYPRVYGGTGQAFQKSTQQGQLSPRVRGNRPTHHGITNHRRTIPACTGEPRPGPPAAGAAPDYPRVYGGTEGWHELYRIREGLSPRVRGNRQHGQRLADEGWTIPACTGEPRQGPVSAQRPQDYPRVYGGTTPQPCWRRRPKGLSPRVRGNPRGVRGGRHQGGTIPACTGEPSGGSSR